MRFSNGSPVTSSIFATQLCDERSQRADPHSGGPRMPRKRQGRGPSRAPRRARRHRAACGVGAAGDVAGNVEIVERSIVAHNRRDLDAWSELMTAEGPA